MVNRGAAVYDQFARAHLHLFPRDGMQVNRARQAYALKAVRAADNNCTISGRFPLNSRYPNAASAASITSVTPASSMHAPATLQQSCFPIIPAPPW
jgi:hypothetical protein